MPPSRRTTASALLALAGALQAVGGAGALNASFITLGDWGGATLGANPLGKTYVANVKAVASSMATVAHDRNAEFIVNTGDNFYWCGIGNVSDFQVKADWVDPYQALPAGMNWYSVLGNHEYGYNVSAQLLLSELYPTWVMDARYYTKRVPVALGAAHITMIFLDTSPCINEYRSTDPSGWDPCGSQYPTCSLGGGTDKFEGECRFHPQIVAQDCMAQYEWFVKALAAAPKDDWLFVVAHHPAEEMDFAGTDFAGAIAKHGGVDLYLNGHAHTLTQYTIDGGGAYITSGAGALVAGHHTDEVHPGHGHAHVEHKQHNLTAGQRRTQNKVLGLPLEPNAQGHAYQQVWNGAVSGFTAHTFSSDFTTLRNDFLGTDGHVLHSFTVTKGKPPAPPPPPAPGTATCKVYGCGSFDRSHPCQCNSKCATYNDCCPDHSKQCPPN